MTIRHKTNHNTVKTDSEPLSTDNVRLDIRYRAPEELRLYDRRLKNHPEDQIIGLMASIQNFGFVMPVLIDTHRIVIEGEALVLAATRLGLREIPTIQIEHLDPNRVRVLRLS